MDKKADILDSLGKTGLVKEVQGSVRSKSFKSTTDAGAGYKNKQNGMDWYNYPLTGKSPY